MIGRSWVGAYVEWRRVRKTHEKSLSAVAENCWGKQGKESGWTAGRSHRLHRATEPPAGRTPLSRRTMLLGLAAVGGISAVNVGAFLGAGGWFTPDTLTTSRFVDRFEQVFGKHDGFRRNHAKGVSASGVFTSNGAGTALSKATVFQTGTTPVTARFSISGGMPAAADANAAVRGLGVLFHMAGGEQWRTAMVNVPVFTDRVPQGFYERLLATEPVPSTGQPDPVKVAAFLSKYPETARAMAVISKTPPSTGLYNSPYHGLNAFRFTNSAGVSRAGALDDDAGGADPDGDGRCARARQGLPLRRADRQGGAGSPALAVPDHGRSTRRPDERRHHAVAGQPASGRRGHAHDRLAADRGARQRAGRQLRPHRAARGDRAVRRPAARRAVRRVRAVLPAQDPRTPSPQRGHRHGAAAEPGRGRKRWIMRTEQAPVPARFTVVARTLHWTMAVMVIAILFIGVFMVTSIADFRFLVTIHEPLGIAILVFVLARIGWRLTHVPPPFPPGMSRLDRLAAKYSERLLYALLVVQPLIGWAMVSASGQPIALFGSLYLPAIAPQNITVFADLLRAHIVAAYLLYLVFAAHLAGVLLHTIVLRDRVLDRMAFWRAPRSASVVVDEEQPVS